MDIELKDLGVKGLDDDLPELASLEEIGLALNDMCSQVSQEDPANVSVIVPIKTRSYSPLLRPLDMGDVNLSPSPFQSQVSSPVNIDRKFQSMYSPRVESTLSPVIEAREPMLTAADFQLLQPTLGTMLASSSINADYGSISFFHDANSSSFNNMSLTHANISSLQLEHQSSRIEDAEMKEDKKVESSLVYQLIVCFICILLLWSSSIAVVGFIVAEDVQVPSTAYVSKYFNSHADFVKVQLDVYNVCMVDVMAQCKSKHSSTQQDTRLYQTQKELDRSNQLQAQSVYTTTCTDNQNHIIAESQIWQQTGGPAPLQIDYTKCSAEEQTKVDQMLQRGKYELATVRDYEYQAYKARQLHHNDQVVQNVTQSNDYNRNYLQRVRDGQSQTPILPNFQAQLTAQDQIPNMLPCTNIATCKFFPLQPWQNAYNEIQDFVQTMSVHYNTLHVELQKLTHAANDLTAIVSFLMDFRSIVAETGLIIPFINPPTLISVSIPVLSLPSFDLANIGHIINESIRLYLVSLRTAINTYRDQLQGEITQYITNWQTAATLMKNNQSNFLNTFQSPVASVPSTDTLDTSMNLDSQSTKNAKFKDMNKTQQDSAQLDKQRMTSKNQITYDTYTEPPPPYMETLKPRAFSLPSLTAQNFAEQLDRMFFLIVASDVVYRCVNTVMFVAKQLSRGFADPPVLDVREDQEEKPSLQCKMVNRFFSQVLMLIAATIIGIVVFVQFLQWYSDAVNTYRHGCVYTNDATGLGKTTSSQSYKYYEQSTVKIREEAGMGYVSQRTEDCNNMGALHLNADKTYIQALAAQKADFSVAAAEIKVLEKCVLWDQMGQSLERLMKGASEQCNHVALQAHPFIAEFNTYSNTAYDECATATTTCESACSVLTKEEMLTSSRATVCVTEWYFYTAILDILLKILLFITLNIARVCFSTFLCRWFWRQLGQGKMYIVSKMFRTGKLDELQETQGVPEHLPQTIKSHRNISLIILLVGLQTPLPYFILLRGRFHIPPPAAIN